MRNTQNLDDTSIMSFGRHKGKKMVDVPNSWLHWFKLNNENKKLYGEWKKVFNYAVNKWDVIEEEEDKEEDRRALLKMLSRRG